MSELEAGPHHEAKRGGTYPAGMSNSVFTRFAPSPTGHLHIGGARTALFCWAFAKRQGGKFVLRIEDTDAARSSDESARGIMEDLAWLGIDWDEGPELVAGGLGLGGDPRGVGPYFQARRVELYNKYILQLVKDGKAYPAFENEQELDAKRKSATAAKQTYRYDRASYHAIPTVEGRLARMAAEPHVIRFFAPHEEVVVHDQVLGEVKYAAGEMDDFVIRKQDGLPTYHFAVVVDDETMGVTHVMRAQEHLNNTPRHVALQKALGFRTPTYAHMPLIFNMDGSKMSKRDKAKAARKAAKDAIAKGAKAELLASEAKLDAKLLNAFLAGENDSLELAQALGTHLRVALPEIEVADFRENGYLPEAIVNFVSLLGWNPGMKTPDGKDLEKFDAAFLAQHFGVERIGKTNSKFDRAKLLSFNGDYLAALPDAAFVQRWLAWLADFDVPLHRFVAGLSAEKQVLLAKAVKPRAKTFRDAAKPIGFLRVGDGEVALDAGAVAKNLDTAIALEPGPGSTTGRELLRGLKAAFEGELDWANPAALEGAVQGFAASQQVKLGAMAQALRTALTGSGVSPALGDSLCLLGRESVLARIARALA